MYSVANAKEEIEMFVNAPSKELKVVEGGAHFLSASNPDEVDSAVLEFCEEVVLIVRRTLCTESRRRSILPNEHLPRSQPGINSRLPISSEHLPANAAFTVALLHSWIQPQPVFRL